MDSVLTEYDPSVLIAAAAIMGLGGFIKGTIGFALPMVAISGLGSLIGAQETLGVLIVPLALMNLWQTVRQGLGAALSTFGVFWRLNLIMGVSMALVAQLVPTIPGAILFTFLGVLVSTTAALQFAGWTPRAPEDPGRRRAVELAVGLLAGIAGGLSGVWGPPVLFFLVALGVPKTMQVRALGITFLIGSVVLVGAHLRSGVLNESTLPVGLMMIPPVGIGMWLGLRLQDRLDQRLFRRITLAVLILAGLNLLRRGLF